jgi:D-alanyl-lipoteichoic acid acyltransferase DltB (MBOAT superfamily)
VQNIFLILASYIFYGYWDWRFIFLLFALTIINFIIGLKLGESGKQNEKKFLVTLGIVSNLSILCFFKYFNFFVDSAASALAVFGLHSNIPLLQIILPVGISFYTFQTMTYTIDIYRDKLGPTKNFIDFALFVCFFPQLLAGPIERATNLLPQIASPRQITKAQVLSGLNLILLGYFKKVAIADTLAPIADKIFASPDLMTSGQLWTGVYAFTIQIYCDFSGYTDIARGIALILGFRIMENFNAPYLSRSITEFWRRWHISLSTWLRDYLYIPLGGNRAGNIRTYTNLIITFLLCGLWHGAAWTFIIWGLTHGLYISAHRIILRGRKVDISWPINYSRRIVEFGKIILTFHIVALTWVLFKSPNFTIALKYFEGLFRFQQFTGFAFSIIFAGLLVLALDLAQTWLKSQTWLTDRHEHTAIRYLVAQFLFFSTLAAAIAHVGTITPFIYFQF